MRERSEIGDILRDLDYRVIMLTRENLLDQFISMRLAQMNSVWRSDCGDYKSETFETDIQLTKGSMDSFERENLFISEYLHDLTRFDITYETIADRLDELQAWLGLEPTELTSEFKRQRSSVLQSDAILNYNELADALQGTVYERFLTG